MGKPRLKLNYDKRGQALACTEGKELSMFLAGGEVEYESYG